MSEMIERAAKAVCPKLPNVSASDCVQTHERRGNYANRPACAPANCLSADIARAALLAALDPEDEALIELVARAMCVELGLHADDWSEDEAGERIHVWQKEAGTAREALAALRKHVLAGAE